MSFGNRKQIVLKADALHAIMGVSPYDYVMSRRWQTDFQAGRKESFYRMLMYADFNGFFQKLHDCYARFDSLEDCLLTLDAESPFRAICQFMQVSDKSPQKKLNMFNESIQAHPLLDIYKSQKEHKKRLPIIAVTARAMFGDKERILENKLDDYIAKPYNLNTVVETLNKYIESKED